MATKPVKKPVVKKATVKDDKKTTASAKQAVTNKKITTAKKTAAVKRVQKNSVSRKNAIETGNDNQREWYNGQNPRYKGMSKEKIGNQEMKSAINAINKYFSSGGPGIMSTDIGEYDRKRQRSGGKGK